ncbi:MAG: aminopeptidase N [Actinomycetaceae bacterium]|nr:aminopeptidase N [Arcanobacterium sp.]MDD7505757.1 aminopeptidase N [Actinomycetaceae bacterium]MDY6143644.1 aminopeptidase N [Arcanobacterium sp.]
MSDNLSRAEAQYRSAHIYTHTYEVEVDVRNANTSAETFATASTITLTVSDDVTTFIDFIGADVIELVIDGKAHTINYDGARIQLPTLSQGQHTITVRGEGYYSRSGEGLHRFTDPEDGKTYLYTQFEPADARRMYPNFEQPDLKAEFTFSVLGPSEWQYISNGAINKQVKIDAAATRTQFAPTRRQSTYLTALIAGSYTEFTREAHVNGTPLTLRFYCRETLAPYFDLGDISTVTAQGLAALPELFDFPYPWGKYDSVFVPEYNLGAMENPGCVTFNESSYIHRHHTTREQRASRANTILHEMSHMWFGDLVTPQWWDDLWLKESFAEFMGAWASANLTQYTEAWQSFAGNRIAWAFANDQYPTTHPITADIPDIEAADQAFDGITYAKGAAILRQLVAWVGEEAFFAGARTYFAKYHFGNATLPDLLDALSQASGKDLHSWARLWLQSSGVSTFDVTRTSEGLTISETGIDSRTENAIRRPHRTSIGIFGGDGEDALGRLAHYEFEIDGQTHISWQDLGIAEPDAAVVVPNDAALTYAKIRFDDASRDLLLSTDVDDDLARAVISTALSQALRDADISIDDYLRFAMTNPHTHQLSVLSQKISGARLAVHRFSLRTDRARREGELFAQAYMHYTSAPRGSDQAYLWLHALPQLAAYSCSALDTLQSMLNQRADIDQETAWQIIIALSARGMMDVDAVNAEFERTGSAFDQKMMWTAKASMPGTRADTLHEITHNRAASNDHVQALINGFAHLAGADEAAEALPHYFDMVDALWASRSQEIAERIVYGLYPMPDLDPLTCDPSTHGGVEAAIAAQLQPATHWLSQPNHPQALRKIITDSRDEHARKLAVQAKEIRIASK